MLGTVVVTVQCKVCAHAAVTMRFNAVDRREFLGSCDECGHQFRIHAAETRRLVALAVTTPVPGQHTVASLYLLIGMVHLDNCVRCVHVMGQYVGHRQPLTSDNSPVRLGIYHGEP